MSPIALRAAALVIAAGLGLTPGLASAETRQNYVPPIGDAPVTSNPTPYTPALTCLAERAAGRPAPRISVGRISDLTGRVDFDTGAKIPQARPCSPSPPWVRRAFPLLNGWTIPSRRSS